MHPPQQIYNVSKWKHRLTLKCRDQKSTRNKVMSDLKLQIDDEDVKFLLLVCTEEISRCDEEQEEMKASGYAGDTFERWELSRKRRMVAHRIVAKMVDILSQLYDDDDTLYEDDGLESRPDLN